MLFVFIHVAKMLQTFSFHALRNRWYTVSPLTTNILHHSTFHRLFYDIVAILLLLTEWRLFGSSNALKYPKYDMPLKEISYCAMIEKILIYLNKIKTQSELESYLSGRYDINNTFHYVELFLPQFTFSEFLPFSYMVPVVSNTWQKNLP